MNIRIGLKKPFNWLDVYVNIEPRTFGLVWEHLSSRPVSRYPTLIMFNFNQYKRLLDQLWLSSQGVFFTPGTVAQVFVLNSWFDLLLLWPNVFDVNDVQLLKQFDTTIFYVCNTRLTPRIFFMNNWYTEPTRNKSNSKWAIPMCSRYLLNFLKKQR